GVPGFFRDSFWAHHAIRKEGDADRRATIDKPPRPDSRDEEAHRRAPRFPRACAENPHRRTRRAVMSSMRAGSLPERRAYRGAPDTPPGQGQSTEDQVRE